MEKFGPELNDAENLEIRESERKIIDLLDEVGAKIEAGGDEWEGEVFDLLQRAEWIYRTNKTEISTDTFYRLNELTDKFLRSADVAGKLEEEPRPEADFAPSPDEAINKNEAATFLRKCERYEHQSNLGDFKEEDYPLMMKFIGGEKLSNDEANRVKKLRNEWWKKDKSGEGGRNACPDSKTRRDYLEKKYGSVEVAQRLRAKFMEIFKAGDEDKIDDLRREYEENFSSQMEGIEALFNLKQFFDNQKNLDRLLRENRKWTPGALEICKRLTEYRFKITDFVASSVDNEKLLANFWQMIKDASEQTGDRIKAEQLKKSTLSQAAVYHAFKKLGFKPKLSRPEEDAFNAIDLWVGPEEVVQVLGTNSDMIADYISFPGVEFENKGEVNHVSDFVTAKTQKFIAKASKYGEKTGKNLKGYMIAIPYDEMDENTGKPSEEFIEFMAQKLGINKKI